MNVIVISVIGFSIVLLWGILPCVKKKQWKSLAVSLPVFLITFVMNIMIGLGYQFTSPNVVLNKITSFIFNLK